jgi:hypothetical protein
VPLFKIIFSYSFSTVENRILSCALSKALSMLFCKALQFSEAQRNVVLTVINSFISSTLNLFRSRGMNDDIKTTIRSSKINTNDKKLRIYKWISPHFCLGFLHFCLCFSPLFDSSQAILLLILSIRVAKNFAITIMNMFNKRWTVVWIHTLTL